MESDQKIKSGGFITTIIVILVAIVVLKFVFGFNIIEFLRSPKVSEWTSYIKDVIVFVWTHYLAGAFSALWDLISKLFENLKQQ